MKHTPFWRVAAEMAIAGKTAAEIAHATGRTKKNVIRRFSEARSRHAMPIPYSKAPPHAARAIRTAREKGAAPYLGSMGITLEKHSPEDGRRLLTLVRDGETLCDMLVRVALERVNGK
jgi:hypothetical protein